MGFRDWNLDDMIVAGLVGVLVVAGLLTTVLTFHTPSFGSVLKQQSFQVAHSDFCDTLYIEHVRPFRFTMSKHSGTFSCGWPSTNTAFRTTLSLFGFLLTGGAAVLAYKEENAALRKVSAIFGLCGACWLSVATLDANALSVGNALCLGGFKVDSDGDSYHLLTGFNKSDLTCAPGPYVWMTLLDFVCVGLFSGAWYLWYVYAGEPRKSGAGGESILQDPFLASQGYASSSPNADEGDLGSAYGNT